MTELLLTIENNNKPYHILEKNNGEFRVVNTIDIYEDGCSEVHKDKNLLIIGRDIIETSTRGLSLLIRSEYKNLYSTAIENCRKFASISMHDYFSLENFGECFSDIITISDKFIYGEIKPRLFRKIIDN